MMSMRYSLTDSPSLRRVYILFNAKHSLNAADFAMLEALEENCQAQTSNFPWTLQAIITKADQLDGNMAAVRAMQDKIFKTAPTCLPPIVTAAKGKTKFGIDEVRQSIVEACGIDRTQAYIVRDRQRPESSP